MKGNQSTCKLATNADLDEFNSLADLRKQILIQSNKAKKKIIYCGLSVFLTPT